MNKGNETITKKTHKYKMNTVGTYVSTRSITHYFSRRISLNTSRYIDRRHCRPFKYSFSTVFMGLCQDSTTGRSTLLQSVPSRGTTMAMVSSPVGASVQKQSTFHELRCWTGSSVGKHQECFFHWCMTGFAARPQRNTSRLDI